MEAINCADFSRFDPELSHRAYSWTSHVISTFVSYFVEKRLSKHPEEFGKGAIEGCGPGGQQRCRGRCVCSTVGAGFTLRLHWQVVLGALLLTA
jgi:TctA family transporter